MMVTVHITTRSSSMTNSAAHICKITQVDEVIQPIAHQLLYCKVRDGRDVTSLVHNTHLKSKLHSTVVAVSIQRSPVKSRWI